MYNRVAMKSRIIFSLLVLLLMAVVVVAAQESKRITVDSSSISFIPEAFMTPMNTGNQVFSAEPERFGNRALFITAPAVKLGIMTDKAARELDRKLVTTDYQRQVADKFVTGLSGGEYTSIAVEKVELVTLNSLPTIKVYVNFKYQDEPYKTTALIYYHHRNDKAYYVCWLGSAKYFDELTKAVQPTIESIEFK